jgi:hypothetical protein
MDQRMTFSFLRKTSLLGLCLLLPALVQAEFLRTSYGVYQHTDQMVKVLVSHDDEAPGIFIVQLDSPVDLQTFHPANMERLKSSHVFIRYDYGTNRYSELLVGNKSYQLKSSTLLLGDLRITVDNVDKAYLSIVHNDQPESRVAPDILGILGLEVVVNNTGDVAVALLEAHQFQYGQLIQPYVVKADSLFLKGEELTASSIGLAFEQHPHPCLGSSAVLLAKNELRKVQKLPDRQKRLRMLTKILEQAEAEKPFRDILSLRSDDKRLIGYRDGEIFLVTTFKRTSEWQTCLVEKVSLKE